MEWFHLYIDSNIEYDIDFDIESEIIAREMGFEPHPCFEAMDNKLWRASNKGNVDIVKILIVAGADIYVNENSKNLLAEYANYKFKKDRSGRQTSVPEGKDHLLDSLRYCVMEFLDKPQIKYSFR